MKAYVDKLSTNLTERYKLYIDTFLVDLWSADGVIEFRVGYCLRNEHKLRSIVLKVSALDAIDDNERRAIIDALFLEIEDQLDEMISQNAVELN